MPDTSNKYIGIENDRIDRIKESLGSENLIAALSETFRVLSEPARLRILMALENGELCVCDIAALINIPQPSVSHHLRALRQSGIIRYRKSGKMTMYSLKDTRISGLLAVARDFSRNYV